MEDRKAYIIQKLGIAGDCEETKQVINRAIQRHKEEYSHARTDVEYLLKLKNELKGLSSARFDYIHWCNIQCAILYLK
ncbi:MAG TPA: hypothetical protein VK666_22080, partial [Chryseolinea sp.]|nr:hypothetical protein [Chryseolinea sp.]